MNNWIIFQWELRLNADLKIALLVFLAAKTCGFVAMNDTEIIALAQMTYNIRL